MIGSSRDRRDQLLVLGASARAAAFSALRAGYLPLAADLFCDLDLRRSCRAERVEAYPRGLVVAAARFPSAPWMYTGALENHPRVVDRIAAARPLLGNRGAVLRMVRDPLLLADRLAAEGLRFPRTVHLGTAVPSDGTWLLKRLRASGGAGVRVWDGSAIAGTRQSEFVLQQRIEGQPCAAVFVAAAGDALLLGVTEQLIGAAWCGARGFQYAGSLGPLPLDEWQRRRWEQIGRCLAREFHLTGLFGVDAVMTTDEVWPVEVNPRYTASVEVLERALRVHAVRLHVEACQKGRLLRHAKPKRAGWCAKAIIYARRLTEIPGHFTEKVINAAGQSAAETWPCFADIPAPGTRVPCARPVLTVLAAAATRGDVLTRLRELVAMCERWLETTALSADAPSTPAATC